MFRQPPPTEPQPLLGLQNRALDRLTNRIARFDQTPKKMGQRKDLILRMVRELDRLRPPNLATAQQGGVTVGEMTANFVALQQMQRQANSDDAKQAYAEQCRDLIIGIQQRLHGLAADILPKREGINPAEREKLIRLNHGPFFRFLNDFIKAYQNDLTDPARRNAVQGPHHFSDLMRHVQHMQAMHQLSHDFAELIKPYKEKPGSWAHQRPAIQAKINYLIRRYEEVAPPQALRQADINEALRTMREAASFDEMRVPFITLRWYPVRSARFCLEQIERAYLNDTHELMLGQMQGDPRPFPGEEPYAQQTKTFDHVYRARWTLAARRVVDLVQRYEATILNASFAQTVGEPSWRHGQGQPQRMAVNPAFGGEARFPGRPSSGRS